MNNSYLITDKMRNDLISMCTHILGYVEKGDHSAEQAYYVREDLEKLAATPELPKEAEEAAREMAENMFSKRDESTSKYNDQHYFEKGFLAGAAWRQLQDGWISVEERLPECFLHIGNKKRINWVIGIRNRDQFICAYTKGHQLEFGDDDYDGEYDEVEERNGTLYLKPGWYSLENTPNGQYDETWTERNPTHWRPLPEPPVKK